MKYLIAIISMFLIVGFAGCSTAERTAPTSNTDVTVAESSPTEATRSETGETVPASSTDPTIVGTWKHVSTAKTVDGKRDPLDVADITWTFEADGSGIYKQTVSGIAAAGGSNPFTWKLNGKDIELTPEKGGKGMTYKIVKESDGEMTWHNSVLNDYFIVEKQ